MLGENSSTAFNSQKIITNLKTNWLNIIIIISIIVIIVVIIKIITKKIIRALDKKISPEKVEIKKRSYTFSSVISNLLIALIILAGILIIADQCGINMIPVITGAGIASIIIGLGAQSLIKDLINGAFILFEQWYQINDVISVGDISGVVEKFNLRTTAIRDLNGAIHYIPNSEIKILSNMTQDWSRALLTISVSYKEDTDRVISELKNILNDFTNDKKYKNLFLENQKYLVMTDR